MAKKRSDVAFSPAVKEAQRQRGSRDIYEVRLSQRDWARDLTPELIRYVQERDTFYLGTASLDGQPYIQHRGGDPGFLVVLDPRTIAFADYRGNRQYISVGNLSENPRVMLFLMDYPNRRRIKIWGRAEVFEGPVASLPEALAPALVASEGEAVERWILVHIDAWDLNCPKHITPRYSSRELGDKHPSTIKTLS